MKRALCQMATVTPSVEAKKDTMTAQKVECV